MSQAEPDNSDDAPITEQYARRVIAAAVDPNNRGFDPNVADEVANAHIKEIELHPDPIRNGDVLVSATIRGIDRINHSKKLEIFSFQFGQLGEMRREDGVVHLSFTGFKREYGSSISVNLNEDGLLVSDDGIKCVFSLTFE
jgi:hypothetical protein